MKIMDKARSIFLTIWNWDYSSFDTEMRYLGFSLVDVIGLFVGLFLLWEFFKFFFSIFADLAREGLKMLFSKLLSYGLVILRKMWSRVKIVLLFFWNAARIRRMRYHLSLRLEQLLHRLQNNIRSH